MGNVNGRTFYGLSRMDGNGGIAYWAAAGEQTPGEGTQLGLPTMNIEKGTYLTKAITNWRGSEHLIGQAFQELMAACNPKPGGYCVEWYQGDDKVICMVPCG